MRRNRSTDSSMQSVDANQGKRKNPRQISCREGGGAPLAATRPAIWRELVGAVLRAYALSRTTHHRRMP
jgi:hypothetical protein